MSNTCVFALMDQNCCGWMRMDADGSESKVVQVVQVVQEVQVV